MGLLDAAVFAVHFLFAGLWTGSVAFVAWGVLPRTGAGGIDGDALAFVVGRLRTISRLSALGLLLTGGHLVVTRYPGGTLMESTRGNLVVLMVVGWAVLAGLVEVGSGKVDAAASEGGSGVVPPSATRILGGAAVLALLLLLDAGVIHGL